MGNFNFQNYIANKRKDRREERAFLRHCIGSGISGSALARMKYRRKKKYFTKFFCQIKSSTYIKANMKSLKFDQILPSVLPLCLSIDYATCFYNFQPLHCQNGNQFRS